MSTSETIASTMSHSSSVSSSVDTPSAQEGAVLGAGDNNTTAIMSGWRFSESPTPYTPASVRAMDSRSSFGSVLTPNSASGGTPSLSNMMGRNNSAKVDYVTFKPVGSSSSSPSSSLTSAPLQYPHQRMAESESATADGVRNKINIEGPIAMNPLALRDSQALLAMDHDQSAEISLFSQDANNPATETDPSFAKEPLLKRDGLGLACLTAPMGESSLASKEIQRQDTDHRDQSPESVQADMRRNIDSDEAASRVSVPHPSLERVKKSSESWIVRDLDVKEGAEC
ncbi:hypothetical protein BG005_001434 [Podila minutissima]|nr:hypothetical protein BG005_001434 [Podila minutissima]